MHFRLLITSVWGCLFLSSVGWGQERAAPYPASDSIGGVTWAERLSCFLWRRLFFDAWRDFPCSLMLD